MHLRGNVIYNTWENFWKKAYKSSYFRAQYDENFGAHRLVIK